MSACFISCALWKIYHIFKMYCWKTAKAFNSSITGEDGKNILKILLIGDNPDDEDIFRLFLSQSAIDRIHPTPGPLTQPEGLATGKSFRTYPAAIRSAFCPQYFPQEGSTATHRWSLPAPDQPYPRMFGYQTREASAAMPCASSVSRVGMPLTGSMPMSS